MLQQFKETFVIIVEFNPNFQFKKVGNRWQAIFYGEYYVLTLIYNLPVCEIRAIQSKLICDKPIFIHRTTSNACSSLRNIECHCIRHILLFQ